jgi:hypothetical protein
MRGTRLVIAAAGLAVAMLGHAAMAQQPVGRTISFTANYTDPGTPVTGVGGVANPCPIGYVSIDAAAYFAAPLKAIDNYHGCLFIDPTKQASLGSTHALYASGETWDKITGSLAGCGTGSFVMHQTDIYLSYNSTTNTGHVSLKWKLENGTGAFAGATGSGTGDGDVTVPTASWRVGGVPNSGSYTGKIVCPHHG